MALTVNLDKATEEAIERRAARLGITASEYIQRLAEKSARPKAHRRPEASPVNYAKPGTGSELADALRSAGVLNGYGDPNIDSQALARRIRQQCENRD